MRRAHTEPGVSECVEEAGRMGQTLELPGSYLKESVAQMLISQVIWGSGEVSSDTEGEPVTLIESLDINSFLNSVVHRAF